MTGPRSAAEFLDRLVDPGSFRSWDTAPDRTGVTGVYHDQLNRAEQRSGADEAVLTGRATIAGHPVAVVVSDFGFLGGSIGVATAHRIIAAVRRATASQLPLLAAPASGGTRMQEGTPAFVEMIAITRAVEAHKAAGLPYLVYLRHPTTGGVMASWASRGHLQLAEPGALLGFLGPSVYQALQEKPFPAGVQVAENLHRHGLIDDVVDLDDLAAVLGETLTILRPDRPAVSRPARVERRTRRRPRRLAVRAKHPPRRPAAASATFSATPPAISSGFTAVTLTPCRRSSAESPAPMLS